MQLQQIGRLTKRQTFQNNRPSLLRKGKPRDKVNWYYVLTSDTTARSMMAWPDKETAHKALKMVRDDAAAQNNHTITMTCEGEMSRRILKMPKRSEEQRIGSVVIYLCIAVTG